MGTAKILVIDNEEGLCRMMEDVLADKGYIVRPFTDPVAAVDSFQPGVWDLVISDVKMPGMDGLEVLRRLRDLEEGLPIIMITAYATVDMSIQALRMGAYDMLTKPFEPDELVFRVENALDHTRLLEENRELKEELAQRADFSEIVGASVDLKDLLERVEKVAARNISVLITGESGTGKELIAKALHQNSPRHEKRFLAINCGSLPETVLESELFGYRKGAFTGAEKDKVGLLEAADGGTLFLDEVGNLPLKVQKTLLRFLQEREFQPIGDTQPIKVDVRIISATNAELKKDVESGAFREDLFYRLNVVTLDLPPLRERRNDIPLLAAHFIKEFNQKFEMNIAGLTPEAKEALLQFSWPGNIRQLRNVIEGAMAIVSGSYLDLETIGQLIDVPLEPGELEGEDGNYSDALAKFEIDYLQSLLLRFEGNVEEVAEAAGMNMATVYRKLKKYRIDTKGYR
ncbi:MAG: sigma-54-dependent Fis family transcriptional regulator [Desulfuromonas sp.]|nr:MAG: sigma-54-dependent Fis family transcriptional regulator [Desulfuromonas sp.]